MSDKVIDFPQYRKLSNNKVYYRIINDREFHEIQIIGTKAVIHRIKAKQYPEILRIKDLLDLSEEAFIISTKNEFERLMNLYSLD